MRTKIGGLFVDHITESLHLGQNICLLVHILALLLFTTSETELYYYHPKVNVGVDSQVAERILGYQGISRKSLNA